GVRRVTVALSLASLLRGDIRLGTITIDGLVASLDQAKDGSWNVDHLFVPTSPARTRSASAPRRILADSIALFDGTLLLSTMDTLPSLPNIRHAITGIQMAAGATTLVGADGSGGAPLRALALEADSPPLRLVSASGDVRWWSDSLRLNIPRLRLPGSRASLRGTIAWPPERATQVALDIIADSVTMSDVRWMSALLPAEGAASATVGVRTAANGDLRYDVRTFDLRAHESQLTGSVSITPGRRTQVRGLSVAMQPLSLLLVRKVFGDTILAAAWRGAIDGTLRATGGFLDSLVIDTVRATFHDARLGGAQSRLRVGGAMDASGRVTRLIGMQVTIDSMDVRTVGAITKAADSLRGALTGRVRLNGPTTNLDFSDLFLRHVDGDRQASQLTGSGSIASDPCTRWFDATLVLDTVAVATLAPTGSGLPLRSTPSGTLTLSAIADTMWIDGRIGAGDGSFRILGNALLDSLRTRVTIDGTMSAIDPGVFIGRKEIPLLSLSGRLHLTLDDSATAPDRHLDLRLDTTSTIGSTQLRSGMLRFGYDSTGFHLDTATLSATGWGLDASGRLALKGTGDDSLRFSATIDSLATLRSLLLDSTGAPRFTDLAGRIRTDSGVIAGSFESARLRTRIGGSDVRVGTTIIESAIGDLALSGLPDSASGFIRGTLSGVSNGGGKLDAGAVTAQIFDGQRARVHLSAAMGDTVDLLAAADVRWPAQGYEIRLDTLNARIGSRRWALTTASQIRAATGSVDVDSLVWRSDAGGVVVAAGAMANAGALNASLAVRSLAFGEVSFLGTLPVGLTGRINAEATVAGTRDAPTISARATVSEMRSADRDRPSLALDVKYAAQRLGVDLQATLDGRRVLDLRGDVPLNLALRDVGDRVVDAPMSLRLRTDSLGLAAFEGVAPRVTALTGQLNAALDIGGTLRRPRGRGTVAITGGAFDIPRYGIEARALEAELELAGDSLLVRTLRVADTQSPRDTAGVRGLVRLAGNTWTEWQLDLQSAANKFRVIDDSRLARAEADWDLSIDGLLAEPRISGTVHLPYAVFTIGPTRRSRAATTPEGAARPGTPTVNGVIVSLGSDVRLRSREANVQLAGELELFGPLARPWISGSVNATRGTYRVDLGPITRTFRVDSGVVVLEGTPDVPAALDIYTSYVVRRPDDDVTIGARLYGTTIRPRLNLTSDLGTATSQSEIVSYLVFGQSTFGVPQNTQSAQQTAQAALVPSIGGFLEGILGTVLPFFSTLQVSTVANEGATNIVTNPLNVFNSFVVTGGRQVGTDSFFSLSGGVCRGSQTSSTGNVPFWLGTAAEYRPKRSIGAQLSIDPGPAPCSRVSSVGDTYQMGFDLTYDWRFRKR
ncbi:MAG: translocation/assembly module TamB domain-containing protein, partial [Gemmatimonadota bacterium]|nr:translocation/assembly module TamB domain-containing protein [Gemmatimonadota bacterium]